MITWNTDVNAPGCPGEIVNEDGRSVLIQQDTDFPGVASTFGWSIRGVQAEDEDGNPPSVPCDHDGTDGSVDCCECGLTASAFISAARDFLDGADGATVREDPGYFE